MRYACSLGLGLLRFVGLTACLFVGLLPAIGHAETCAWLNTATAGGLLGGEASLTVARAHAATPPTLAPADEDAVCTFAAKAVTGEATLTIAVRTLGNVSADYAGMTQSCGTGATALRAVGNEAVECSMPGENRSRIEKVVGRTRNRAFLLTWMIPNPEDGPNAVSRDAVREKMRNLAEQVAGSLF